MESELDQTPVSIPSRLGRAVSNVKPVPRRVAASSILETQAERKEELPPSRKKPARRARTTRTLLASAPPGRRVVDVDRQPVLQQIDTEIDVGLRQLRLADGRPGVSRSRNSRPARRNRVADGRRSRRRTDRAGGRLITEVSRAVAGAVRRAPPPPVRFKCTRRSRPPCAPRARARRSRPPEASAAITSARGRRASVVQSARVDPRAHRSISIAVSMPPNGMRSPLILGRPRSSYRGRNPPRFRCDALEARSSTASTPTVLA